MDSYSEAELRSRVDSAMQRVRAVLDRTRNPQWPSEVPHRYDDKYLLVEVLTRVACASVLQCLEVLGVTKERLGTLREWAGTRAVTLRFGAREDCAFVREETRKVDSAREHVTEVTGLIEGMLRRTDKVVTTITEYVWGFDFEYELSAYPGTDVSAAVTLHARQGKVAIKTAAKTTPRPTSVVRPFVELDLSWWLRQLDEQGRCRFAIDRTKSSCHTPRRNDELEGALAAVAHLFDFCAHVRAYFRDELFPAQQDHGRDLAAIDDAAIFVPVLPLFDETSSGDGLLPSAYAEGFLAEERRSLSEKCRALAAAFPRDESAITAIEATLLVTLAHVQTVARTYASGVDHVERLLTEQLVAAIGKEIGPADFDAYMRFHHRKLLLPEFRPAPFSYAIRRPDHDPEGSLALEVDHGSGRRDSVPTTVARQPMDRPMTFALDAATRVSFTGERHVHAWVSHQFSGQPGPKLELVARARQFSSFLLLVGRIASADVFEPRFGVIVQNKDGLEIPLLLKQIPSAKEFRDAIESLSPEQQRFARAFRAMQLESTLFAVCVIQIKPQLERLLRLPPDSLTKEIRMSQEILGLFIEHQIPSDLLSYDGPADAPQESKLDRVRAHVGKMQELVAHSKQRQLEEEREREAFRLAEMNRSAFAAGGMPPPMPFGPPAMGGAPMMPSAMLAPPGAVMRPMRAPVAPSASSATPATLVPPPPAPSFDDVAVHPAAEPPSEAIGSRSAPGATPSRTSPAHPSGHDGTLDFTRIPAALDRRFEQIDDEGAVRATILEPGPTWTRTAQRGLLGSASKKSLGDDEQKVEKHKAFDLLDALTKSGALPIEDASLHVIVAAMHCFDRTLLGTIVEGNVNPIERVERSLVVVGETVHGRPARELVEPAELERLIEATPLLESTR